MGERSGGCPTVHECRLSLGTDGRVGGTGGGGACRSCACLPS